MTLEEKKWRLWATRHKTLLNEHQTLFNEQKNWTNSLFKGCKITGNKNAKKKKNSINIKLYAETKKLCM
jgi:hypothetical protein